MALSPRRPLGANQKGNAALFSCPDYDGLGRRVAKRTYDSSGKLAEHRRFYHSPDWQVVQEHVLQASGKFQPERSYVWGQQGPNDLVARIWTSYPSSGPVDSWIYPLQDPAGNVTSLVGLKIQSGQIYCDVLERFHYDPYGRPYFFDKDGDLRSPHRSSYAWDILYGGYQYDRETGLYHVRQRVFHPDLGVWLQPDPQGYAGGPNLYQYCNGSPLTYTDPMGEVVLPAALIAAGIYYLLKVGIESGVETAFEAGIAHCMDDETFSVGGAFGRNMGVNFLTGWIPGAVESKIAFKAGRLGAKIAGRAGYKFAYYGMKYGSEYLAETAVETAWEVGYNRRPLAEVAAEVGIANLIGHGVFRPVVRGAGHVLGRGIYRLRWAPAYRAEGGLGRPRLSVDVAGDVEISRLVGRRRYRGGVALYIGFSTGRARHLMAEKGREYVVSFDVKRAFLRRLRRIAVPEVEAPTARYIPLPWRVDLRWPDQFGIPPLMFDELQAAIRRGSGRIIRQIAEL